MTKAPLQSEAVGLGDGFALLGTLLGMLHLKLQYRDTDVVA